MGESKPRSLGLHPKVQGGRDRKSDCGCRWEPYSRASSVMNKTLFSHQGGSYCKVVRRELATNGSYEERCFAGMVENGLEAERIRSRGKRENVHLRDNDF